MQVSKSVKLLKIYLNEDAKYKGHSLVHAVILKIKELGATGATVYRGIEGFGNHSVIHSAHILDLSEGLPVMIEVIEEEELLETLIPLLKEMVHDGIMTLTDIKVI
ncbi:MAG: DUF190 domain-containing protein [Eubacteriaceae bacterium]|nr:DUF190 domain-containing protein [Eubacteriaceae bacterium]